MAQRTDDDPFADADRRLIAAACRGKVSALSDIAAALGRKEGAVRSKVSGMVDAGLLTEEPPPRSRTKTGFRLAVGAIPLLEAAEQRAVDRPDQEPGRVVEKGQRLVLIDGEDLPRIALALRELSVERHARWIARVDGRRSRLLVALDDDAVRADELEAALHRVQGSVTQAKIDQFFSPHAFAQWLDRIRSESE